MRGVALILAAVVSWLGSATAHAEPAVLARYEVRRPGHPRSELELLRDGDRVEHRYLASDAISIWRRIGPDELEHLALSPRARKGVRYTAGDLRALAEPADWSALGSLLSREERASLAQVGAQRVEGRTLPRLRGMLRGKPVRVTWRDDVALPSALTLGSGRDRVALRLLAVESCTAGRCQPTSTKDFTLLDFADLGDMTYDPYVRAYLSRHGHHHDH